MLYFYMYQAYCDLLLIIGQGFGQDWPTLKIEIIGKTNESETKFVKKYKLDKPSIY